MVDQPSSIRFSLRDVPAAQRRETLTEVFGRGVVNMDFEPLTDRPVFEFESRIFPRVAVTRGFNSPHISNNGYDPARRNDDLMLAWASAPARGRMLHRGKEILGDGTGAFVSCTENMVGETLSPFHFWNIRVQRDLLAQLLPSPEDRLMVPVNSASPAFALLRAYIEIVGRMGEDPAPELAHAIALHVADLVALSIGVSRDAAQVAALRGGRAARTAALKQWLLERLDDPALSVGLAAAYHRISPRYIQRLFEAEGTSFGCWLREQRLALARRRLLDPALRHRPVSTIAFDCGFSDVSWFNHAYRRAFGECPTDTRASRVNMERWH